MITPPPQGEGCLQAEEREASFERELHKFSCSCGLIVHIADLQLHALSCQHLQPTLRPIPRITDPTVFINSGLTPPRSLSLRARKKTRSLVEQVSFFYEKMSELLEYREEVAGQESHETLSTPPPAVMSFQIDETKPNISQISPNNSKQDSEEDENSQTNGIMSPADGSSKTDEVAKDMAAVLDVLFGGETPTVASMPSNPESSGGENSPPAPAKGPTSVLPSLSPPIMLLNQGDTEKDKEESGSEFNSLIDEMLEDKEKTLETPPQPQNTESPLSPNQAVPTIPQPAPPTIRMRPMLDLMGSNGGAVKEEKIEEPFAALNDLVKNLQSPPNSVQPPPSHILKNDFPPMTSITAHPPPSMLGGSGLQVSIQKRPAQSFPPGITMTKQPRRDSESSSSSSQGPSSPKLPEGITLVKPGQKDPVASMLATRGVSVMPSARPETQAVSITKTAPKPSTQILSGSNSALTITATPPKRNRPSPVPVTTVDLTDDSVPPVRRPVVAPPPQVTTMMRPRVPIMSRGRPPAATCDVCDKVFANAEALRVHMQSHTAGRRGIVPPMAGPPRNPMRQPVPGAPPGPYPPKPGVFECEVCTARYQTQQQLMQHTQRFHPDRFGGAVGHQFGLPVVNLDDSKTPSMLASLGIRYCIPMVDLQQSNGAPGHYALPVIAMDGSINPAVCNLDHMKCSNLLPLGPMKAIRRQ